MEPEIFGVAHCCGARILYKGAVNLTGPAKNKLSFIQSSIFPDSRGGKAFLMVTLVDDASKGDKDFLDKLRAIPQMSWFDKKAGKNVTLYVRSNTFVPCPPKEYVFDGEFSNRNKDDSSLYSSSVVGDALGCLTPFWCPTGGHPSREALLGTIETKVEQMKKFSAGALITILNPSQRFYYKYEEPLLQSGFKVLSRAWNGSGSGECSLYGRVLEEPK